MKHFVIVGVIVIIVTVLVSMGLDAVGVMPPQASAQAVPIDNLFNMHLKVISFLFALIVTFLVYSVIVFRRKKGETGDGDHFEGHTGLEITWTIFPLITVLYFSYLGAQALAETRRVDPQAIEINVTGVQWSWRFDYPDQKVISTELVLPINRQALLKLTSTDVIHSFWVPEFRVKQDALPGADMVKDLRITPTQLGEFKVRCAELCGRDHAYMENTVRVVSEEEYKQWLQEQSAKANDPDPTKRGKFWAEVYGCASCHSANGTARTGPTWKGVFGSTRTLEDHTTVTADEAYLRRSILTPNAQVVYEFPANRMPQNFEKLVSSKQIDDLIAYIKTLK
ncbi:MAG: cytochrome c oxidase subunit II [Chloroflexi bacterium]|nr:cytochrome c oxidase subunit II [Chloroflexota bacterium]